jgi:hypothetical protein
LFADTQNNNPSPHIAVIVLAKNQLYKHVGICFQIDINGSEIRGSKVSGYFGYKQMLYTFQYEISLKIQYIYYVVE